MNKSLLIIAAIFVFQLPVIAQSSTTKNIGERTFMFKDESRNRPVVTELWYPTNDVLVKRDESDYPFIHIPTVKNAKLLPGKQPLIMISHGTGGGRKTLEWLVDRLVEAGFMVAAVDHYGNTYDNKIAADFLEPWQRPQDITYALTSLLKDQEIGSSIDENHVGAAGFSIGGYTVLALAGAKLDLMAIDKFSQTREGKKEMTLPEFPDLDKQINDEELKKSFDAAPPLKDSRIKAFFAICPAVGQGFTKKSQVATITAPVYIVGAQCDSICPINTNALHYHQLIKNSKLEIVPGKVGHYVFLNEAKEEIKKQGAVYFNDDASVNRKLVHEHVGNLAAAFFTGYLK